MFTKKPVSSLRAVLVSSAITRNKTSVTDPVQQLFINKIKEYKTRSKNDEFVEPSTAILKELAKEIDKLDKTYGGGKGIDMTAFPEFRFAEPTIDPIDEPPEKEVKKGDDGGKKVEGKREQPPKK